MLITLSDASAEVLERVPNLKRWTVAPPMTRGSKAVMQGSKPDVDQATKSLPKAKAKTKPINMHVKKPRMKTKTSKAKVVLPTGDHTAESIRRTASGRSAIIDLMQDLMDEDSKAFPGYPCFNGDGFCKLNFEAANKFSREMLRDGAPKAFETLYPDDLLNSFVCFLL